MAFTGYDPNVVRTAITNIGNSYDALIDALVTKNQTNFVQAMGSVWASEQAKEFFSAYQTDIARLVLEVNKVYDSIANAMNSAAKTLASTSGSTWSNVDIVIKEPIIDLSSIKDNIFVQEVPFDKAIKFNPAYRFSAKKHNTNQNAGHCRNQDNSGRKVFCHFYHF